MSAYVSARPYQFQRPGEEPVTVHGVPGRNGYIEVPTEFALSLLRKSGRDGVLTESLPGCVMFTIEDFTDLLAHDGWSPVEEAPNAE